MSKDRSGDTCFSVQYNERIYTGWYLMARKKHGIDDGSGEGAEACFSRQARGDRRVDQRLTNH